MKVSKTKNFKQQILQYFLLKNWIKATVKWQRDLFLSHINQIENQSTGVPYKRLQNVQKKNICQSLFSNEIPGWGPITKDIPLDMFSSKFYEIFQKSYL